MSTNNLNLTYNDRSSAGADVYDSFQTVKYYMNANEMSLFSRLKQKRWK